MKGSDAALLMLGVIGVSLAVLFALSRTQFGYQTFFKIKGQAAA